MSTIADYSVFTKAFLTANHVDFSKPYGKLDQDGNWGEVGDLKAFAVVPLTLDTPLTPREAMNFDWSKLGSGEDMQVRVSCRDADGNFIGNIVRVQPGVREGSIRLVAKVAVPAANEGDVADIKVNTFVLLRTDSSTSQDLPIAVATISAGYRLHKHLASGNDPLEDVENATYVSFTINNLNGYTSVDFNPDAYATYDDVANALSRGIDGLHIAFDTNSGDLKLLDKDGNVLDQANLPIKTDVIIAEGEEGYKYVKTDVKQDIHAAKAWMPEGKTAWEEVPEAPYTMQHAALVVGKGSSPASRVFVDSKSGYNHPISTEPVQFDHVVIGDSTYMVVDKNETEANCTLIKVKGKAEATLEILAGISSEGKVTHGDTSYPITNEAVDVDVIKDKDGVTTLVLAGTNNSNKFRALSTGGRYNVQYSGTIVTFGGSTTASRVFVDLQSGSYPISTEPVQFDHVVIDGSTYMVAGKNETETTCNLLKVKGDAGIPTYYDVPFAEGKVTIPNEGATEHPQLDVNYGSVDVDVVTINNTRYVLGESGNSEYLAIPTDSGVNSYVFGFIVTSEVSSAGKVLGITLDSTTMYTFEEGATTPLEFKDSSGHNVTWFGTKTIPEGYTLKYGLEAFVWTVKDAEAGDKISDPFFQQLNASLLALGFHEGDDIALGTNLSILAPTDGVSPLNKVDADDYMHGKDNKATREQEVNTQRANAKEELVAWNAQHPALTEERSLGTIIDSSGLDVRKGSITLGCGRVGQDGTTQKVNYGIQMKDRSQNGNSSESLDFTVSQTNGTVVFDNNGHAKDLISSTLLSIESGSYISGAPTCLILAKVTRKPKDVSSYPEEGSIDPLEGSPVLTPVRTTAGFRVEPNYATSTGLELTIQDNRDNILRLLYPNLENSGSVPAIIEVQAIYTHPNAETVPAQQMHTYIGSWTFLSAGDEALLNHPECRFFCNKIEEWMTAVGLADAQNQDSELYVVIRVY